MNRAVISRLVAALAVPAVSVVAIPARAGAPCIPNAPASTESVQARFDGARADQAARHDAAAAAVFRAIALEHVGAPESLPAALRYLESATEVGRSDAACWDEVLRDIGELRRVHCTTATSSTCDALVKAHADLRRDQAQRLVAQADENPDGPDARASYGRGARAYASLYDAECAGNLRLVQGCDEIGYSAVQAFVAARDRVAAITMGGRLVDHDAVTGRGSRIAHKVKYLIADSYQAMGGYERAADWYETYALEDPRADRAPDALQDAVLLRLGLGQTDRAEADVHAYARAYGATRRAETAAVAYALAARHVDRDAWDTARVVLGWAMGVIDRGSPDVTVAGHALYGRVLARAGMKDRATAEYQKSRDTWRDPEAMTLAIDRAWPNEADGQRLRRLATALTAVGEAWFVAAEGKRADVSAIRLPAAAAGTTPATFVIGGVEPWIRRRRAAIASAESEYLKILELRPVPPPRWVVAAGAATAAMWIELADDLARGPAAWRADKKTFAAYEAATRALRAEIEGRDARPAAMKCIDLATKYAIVDERLGTCSAWLARRYPREHWRVDELLPGLHDPGLREGFARAAPLPATSDASKP
jgi:hypothetical protein